MLTLTNSPHRANPFGERVKAFRYNFSEPAELEKSLRNVDANYWVRFDKPPTTTRQVVTGSWRSANSATRSFIAPRIADIPLIPWR